ncbi:MAG: hypothetical protein ACRENI_05020 [Gemmatimonadaceae bacterium]
MSDFESQSESNNGEQAPGPGNRRSNLVLRALIDEMLARVRELNRNSGVWAGEELAQAEADLDAIMARVRRVAAQGHTT